MPARNSRGHNGQWLGIDKGATWAHSGEPLNFTNWRSEADGNRDRASIITVEQWIWGNDFETSEKAAFICEKNI